MTAPPDPAAAADVPARRRRRGAVLGLLLAGILGVTGCGPQATTPTAADTDAGGGQAGGAEPPPPVTRLARGAERPALACPSGERSMMVAQVVRGARGAPTPEQALAEERLRDGERLVISRAGGRAWVVRPDGTAREEIGLLRMRGWLVQERESCA